jgi:hypothetical protein
MFLIYWSVRKHQGGIIPIAIPSDEDRQTRASGGKVPSRGRGSVSLMNYETTTDRPHTYTRRTQAPDDDDDNGQETE